MPYANRVFLIGRLGRDPESRTTQSGKPFTRLSLATNHWWKDDQGNRQHDTHWHHVNILQSKAASFALEALKTGDLVIVEGRLTYNKLNNQEEQGAKFAQVLVGKKHEYVFKIDCSNLQNQPFELSQTERKPPQNPSLCHPAELEKGAQQ